MIKKKEIAKLNIKDLAGLICQTLNDHKVDAVVVGGACVSVYTNNQYMSYDIDVVCHESLATISTALKKLGFILAGKYFTHPDSKFFIDFVSPPVSIGDEPIDKFQFIETEHGLIKLLTPTDCVKDRLAAYYYWNDKQSLAQATLISQSVKIDYNEIKRWSIKEGQQDKWKKFVESSS